ncbi:MAG: UDP-3-O-(3-hydroxymyristoyl)glucosamine N-acyltransferase [Desulfuromonas sp.]|nr:MAG: UDP-3-O-(3-hydroxymyristoyl)glucosamine N-acyltransferase [Desulfuromonas sp.]
MAKSATLAELAELVGGKVIGDPGVVLTGVAPLDLAGSGQISFLTNPKYRSKLADCGAGAIIVHPGLEHELDRPLLLVKNPYLAFAKVLSWFVGDVEAGYGVSPQAHVDPQARVADDVAISPGCVIGAGATIGRGSRLHPNVVIYPEAVIGEDCLLHANVTVREGCLLGNRVILQPGAVIGSDGFGYAPDGEVYFKIPQVGRVILEDDVEIGACACVDRGTLGDTRIGRGCKIDNQVHIAHNVEVGEHSVLTAQVGVAGSARIGRHAIFGGQSAVAGHVRVGDNVTVAGRGGVTRNVEDNQNLAGLPMQPHREWLKSSMCLPHLPEMRRELQRLKQQLAELQGKLDKEQG